ncbi:MAG TPA: FG-GAP-like repeat-containing protein [Candidatus Dormibacteraeota bacterium]|nr:FG-GAP-like repeat-containing protein [Candidatus Dormibacteraeota bacterium]
MFEIRYLLRVVAVLCLTPVIALAQLTYTNTFLTHLPGSPEGLAVADFNRDGKPDFGAVYAATVSIFFNQGAGNFGAQHDTALGSGSASVQALAADVNNDGKIDLVIAQSQPLQMVVLLGNGDGTFQPPLTFALVNTPLGIALGDFNQDGKVDLAVRECPTNSTDCDVAVYLGGGTGAFTLDTVLPAPGSSSSTRSLVATDLNRDGTIDIATAALGGSSSAPTASFTVFFGNGNGTFRSPVTVPVPFTVPANSVAVPPSIVAGDFNGEATPDIGVETGSICGGSACGQSTMNIFIDNGAGGFTLKQQFQSASQEQPSDWRAADLNNDLKIDLARISGNIRTGGVQTWTNNGTGTFTTVTNSFAGDGASYGEVRDLDLDGRHDLIVDGNGLGESNVAVGLSQNGTPICVPPPSNVLQAKICAPGATTSSTTFTVKASGNSPVGIKRLELWVDGTKRAQILNDQLLKTLTLTVGTHQVTVVAVDQYIGIAKTTRSVNVQ